MGLYNKDLKPEQTKSIDAGVSIELFNRVTLETSWYNRRTEQALLDVHSKMCKEITLHGGRVDGIYYCTALTEADVRRKPGNGMFLEILHDYPDIRPECCVMIGDNDSDMEFAENCGIKGIKVE